MKTELNEHTRFILGRPCFACYHIAYVLRHLGIKIPFKAEGEQAVAIHFMLNLYETYENDWRNKYEVFLDEADESESQADKRKTLEKFTGGKTEFNEYTKWILGLVNFRCWQYAPMIKVLKHDMSKDEFPADQQAEVIHFLLNLYEEHGDSWRKEFEKSLEQLFEQADVKIIVNGDKMSFDFDEEDIEEKPEKKKLKLTPLKVSLSEKRTLQHVAKKIQDFLH